VGCPAVGIMAVEIMFGKKSYFWKSKRNPLQSIHSPTTNLFGTIEFNHVVVDAEVRSTMTNAEDSRLTRLARHRALIFGLGATFGLSATAGLGATASLPSSCIPILDLKTH